MTRPAKLCVGDEIFSLMQPTVAAEQYRALLMRLYPNESIKLTALELKRLLSRDGNIIVFRIADGTIVSTAQATLIPVEPTWQAVVSNVITLEAAGRQGHGRAVMDKLTDLVAAHWGRDRRVNLVLTNNKNKGNSTFYTGNGWVEVSTTLYAYVGKAALHT